MLDRVRLTNFRTHRALDERLGPLTFIVGQNDSGKTNVLRALRWALLNEGQPLEDMASHADPTHCAVEVWLGGVKIARSRTQRENIYALTTPGLEPWDEPETTTLGKVGQGLIPEVAALTGVRPVTAGRTRLLLNYQGVGEDSPLDLGPTDLAHLLTSLSGAGPVEDAARDCAGRVREIGSAVKQAEGAVARAEGVVESLAGADDLPALIDAAESARELHGGAAARHRELAALLARAWDVESAPSVEDVERLRAETAEVERLASEARARWEDGQRWRELAARLAEVERAPSVEDVAALEEIFLTLPDPMEYAERAANLRGLGAALAKAEERIQRCRAEADQLEEELHEAIVEVGACPLCGQAVTR